uniref:Uncharacterized protein n=1 Tax=Glossina pallidipes TaxID=7398 RepID=A0A1A9ZEN6_GLOPL
MKWLDYANGSVNCLNRCYSIEKDILFNVVQARHIYKYPITEGELLVVPSNKSYRLLFNSGDYSNKTNAKESVYVTRPDVAPIGLDILKRHFDVSDWNKCDPVPREDLLKQIAGKSALYCTLVDKIDNEVITKAGPQLKCIATPDVLTDATAELTMALLLATGTCLFEPNKDVYSYG